MVSIADKLKQHWLISILTICAGVAGATWKVSDEISVKPREFEINRLDKINDDLKSDLATGGKVYDSWLKHSLASAPTPAKASDALGIKESRYAPGQSANPDEVVVNFAQIDTASAPEFTVAAAPYLLVAGISIANLKPRQSEVVLRNNRGIYGGQAIIPTTSQNFLTQISTDIEGTASFTLVFAKPCCDSVSFTRPTLYAATKSGVTHPAWSAHALDAQGQELSSQSEGIIRKLPDIDETGQITGGVVPLATYTLHAPGFERIAAIRFDSDWRLDGKPFTGFRAIVIERLTFVRRAK